MQPPADAPDLSTHSATGSTPDADTPTESSVTVPGPAAGSPAAALVPAPREEPPPAAAPVPAALTEREEQILGFERKWWKHAGSKEQAIRDAFGLSATRYYQLLNGLLDNPAAMERDPVLVARLRRLRSTRTRTRRR